MCKGTHNRVVNFIHAEPTDEWIHFGASEEGKLFVSSETDNNEKLPTKLDLKHPLNCALN